METIDILCELTHTVNVTPVYQLSVYYQQSSALNRSATRDDFQVYARTLPMSVKAGAVEAFTELIESEIIPLVRHQKGFQDALTLIVPGSREAIGISVWSRRMDADRYGRCTEKQVMSRLALLLDDFGTAKTFQISNSTFHKIGTRVSL